MSVSVSEQPRDGLTRACRSVERRAVFAQTRIAVDRLRRGHGVEIAAADVEHELELEKGLEPAAEARTRAPDTLGDRAETAMVGGVEMQHPVGFAVADGSQHDRFGLQCRPQSTILCEVTSPRVTIYTTEACGYCRTAKALLDRRGVPYEERNLARDPDGRAQLVERTGMMTFPQIMIDGEPIGGYQELKVAERDGKLDDLVTA